MPQIDVLEFTADPSRALQLARQEELLITEDGTPKFSLIVIAEEEEWEEEILSHPKFLTEIEQAKQELREGKWIPLEDIDL